MQAFTLEDLHMFQQRLETHPIYSAIETMEDLRVFMTHHVYCVWDFMSLLKSLQHSIAPVTVPWMPSTQPELQRLINEIVLVEESDVLLNGGHSSHFELYLSAMSEVGVSTVAVKSFLDSIKTSGLEKALTSLPEASRLFTQKTFSFIQPDKAYLAAVAFCIGRESIIPTMFSNLIEKCGISPQQAPMFHYYLQRHIEVDGEEHGPIALKLLNELCGTDPQRIAEARVAAVEAVEARIQFMNGVLEAMTASSVS